jgi:hypothetical protein
VAAKIEILLIIFAQKGPSNSLKMQFYLILTVFNGNSPNVTVMSFNKLKNCKNEGVSFTTLLFISFKTY